MIIDIKLIQRTTRADFKNGFGPIRGGKRQRVKTMVINLRIGRRLNQTIIGYRIVEQTPWVRLPIGLRIYSKGLSILSDRHFAISTHRDGCKQARAVQDSWVHLDVSHSR